MAASQLAEVAGRALRRTPKLLGETLREFLDDRCQQLAAAIAFYALFAIFPLTILLVAAFGVVAGDDAARREVTDLVLENVPLRESGGRRQIADALAEVTSNAGAFGIIGIAGLLFSASGLMGALRHSLSRVFDVEEGRPALLGKLFDVGLVLGVGLVVGLSLVLTVLERLATTVLPELVRPLGQLTPMVLAAVVFAFLYRVVPATEVRWRDCVPGAVLAAVCYEALKTAFSFYVANFASYGAVYGSIATAIAFAFFVFLSANVFLAGAELTAVWRRLRQRTASARA